MLMNMLREQKRNPGAAAHEDTQCRVFKTVQENLGHATAAFTLDVYGHVSERMKEDSAARMQGYFENLKKA